MGGNPNPGSCRGPCDLKAIEGRFANFYSPDTPAAVYRRGEQVTIKYQRNNHGPGGFVRHTLVPPEKMMDKGVHERNAFSYSCFGATPVQAQASDLGEDKWGFSIVGNDGKKAPTGYYTSTITIPDVVPDGKYVLGWVWYGGTGGDVSNGPYTKEPWWKGYFGDYWSCSFVEISGGNKMVSSYKPIFDNDMRQFSGEGCMSANDSPGVCTNEPCIVKGSYMKPRPFKDDEGPPALTPENFGGSRSSDDTVEERVSLDPRIGGEPAAVDPESSDFKVMKGACQCIALGSRCKRRTATKTNGYCEKLTPPERQPSGCRDTCCNLCRVETRENRRVCSAMNVRAICG